MHLLMVTALFLILWVPGCAGSIKPITNGSLSDLPEPGSSVVVWGQHKGAVGTAVTTLQQMGLSEHKQPAEAFRQSSEV